MKLFLFINSSFQGTTLIADHKFIVFSYNDHALTILPSGSIVADYAVLYYNIKMKA